MDDLMDYDDAMAAYDTALGLEVHVELNTKSKMFCGCANQFGGEPNTQTCPTCLGLPGSLPTANAAAIESTIRIGLALGCRIATWARFSRKNYFYPDIPKGFQTTQYDEPLCTAGHLDVEVDGETYRVDITGVGVKAEGKRHFYLSIDGMPEEVVFEPLNEFVGGGSSKRKQASEPGHVSTTMPGNIVDVLVKQGDTVKAGQAVLITEAMKMETEVQSAIAGKVAAIHVAKGDRVNPGEILIEIEG